MFTGHVSVDSHQAVASPAMTVWDNGSTQTLVLIWGGGDGKIYLASGMEQAGVINPTVIPKMTTLERPALIQFEDRLVISFMGTDNKVWGAVSYNGGGSFSGLATLKVDGADIDPYIGGPALIQWGARVLVAGTQQSDQEIGFGWSLAPPQLYTYTSTIRKSIDTVAFGVTPDANHVQLAYAATNDPHNNLTLQPDIDHDNLPAAVTFTDEIYGGPALVNTVDGYAAAFVNKLNNIVLLYGVENLDPANVNRVILQDSSWHAPAVATLNGVTYLAWIGTDDAQGQGIPTGKLNFADLGSLKQVTCFGSSTMQKMGAQKMVKQFQDLRDQHLLKTPVGRQLAAWLDHHSHEVGRLAEQHPELAAQAWALAQKLEPLAADPAHHRPDDSVLQHAHDLLQRVEAVAGPQLRGTIARLRALLPSFPGRTLHDGLAHAAKLEP